MLYEDLIEGLVIQNTPLAQKIRKNNKISDRESSERAYAFIISCLKVFNKGITEKQLQNTIIDGFGDGCIDAVLFKEKDKIISIFDFKASDNFNRRDFRDFILEMENYLFSGVLTTTGLSTKAIQKIKKIRRLISSDWKINFYSIRNGNSNPTKQIISILETFSNKYTSIAKFETLNRPAIIDLLLKTNLEKNDCEWKFSIVKDLDERNKIIIKKGKTPIGLIVRITLDKVVRLKLDFERKGLDLFDANVRGFQKNKPLSRKILYTVKNEPSKFYTFHNGLTFSCRGIEINKDNDFKVKFPQVINGCQTISSLYEFYKDKLKDPNLKKANIICRFYVLDSDNVEKVCEATNTQVKINLWDLRSNDSIQKVFQLALETKNIHYNRKKGLGVKNPSIQLTELAQWIYASKYQKPAESKNKKSQLFDILQPTPVYKKIFRENHSLDDLVQICEIGNFIKKRIAKIPKKSKLPYDKDADLHYITGMYFLREKKGSLENKFIKTRKAVKKAVHKIRQTNKDINKNRIFTKMEETWNLTKKALK